MAQKIPAWAWLLGAAGLGFLIWKITASAASAQPVASAGAASAGGQLPSAAGTFGTGVALSSGQGAAGSAAAGVGENQAINQMFELSGSSAPTAASNAAGATYWATLTPITSIGAGWIDMPSGAQVPAADLPTATDGLTTFVLWGTDVYALGAQDVNGNYPATLVAGG